MTLTPCICLTHARCVLWSKVDGPVRSVRAERDFGLVLEIAFEGLNRSTRH